MKAALGARLRRHWFLAGLAGVSVLAFAAPELAARGGPLRPELTTKAGVMLIFLLQGLSLTPAALRAGTMRWRLHTAVQLFVFVGFPLVVIALDALAGHLLEPELRLGFLFLAILPTTISSCVVFTAAAGGNVAGAVFNSVLANTAGVIITPLWAALLLSARGAPLPLAPMMAEIGLLLVLPLAVGQLARPAVRRFREPDRQLLATVSSVIILYIIYAAFAASVLAGGFSAGSATTTLAVAVVAAALFVAATAAAASAGRRLGFDAGDRVALLFCAPQKTLAAGAPMAQVLFSGHPGIGVILLPVVLYHAVQLTAGAALAARLRATADAADLAAAAHAPTA